MQMTAKEHDRMTFELPESYENLTPDDLRRLTNALIDDVLHMLRHPSRSPRSRDRSSDTPDAPT